MPAALAGVKMASTTDVAIFFLLLMGLAVAFMLWVLWAIEKQIRKGR